jgi:hypothetical protein
MDTGSPSEMDVGVVGGGVESGGVRVGGDVNEVGGRKVIGEVRKALERVAAARNDPLLVQREAEAAVAAVAAWEASQEGSSSAASSSQT